MPLSQDIVFGVLYLSPEDFLARAKSFGVDPGGLTPQGVAPTLALASRNVEAHLKGRTFTAESPELPMVAAAVGFTAAELLQEAEANEMLPAKLTRSKVGSEDLSRSPVEVEIPAKAQMLLRSLQRLACA